jgi:hypothetical protein
MVGSHYYLLALASRVGHAALATRVHVTFDNGDEADLQWRPDSRTVVSGGEAPPAGVDGADTSPTAYLVCYDLQLDCHFGHADLLAIVDQWVGQQVPGSIVSVKLAYDVADYREDYSCSGLVVTATASQPPPHAAAL